MTAHVPRAQPEEHLSDALIGPARSHQRSAFARLKGHGHALAGTREQEEKPYRKEDDVEHLEYHRGKPAGVSAAVGSYGGCRVSVATEDSGQLGKVTPRVLLAVIGRC